MALHLVGEGKVKSFRIVIGLLIERSPGGGRTIKETSQVAEVIRQWSENEARNKRPFLHGFMIPAERNQVGTPFDQHVIECNLDPYAIFSGSVSKVENRGMSDEIVNAVLFKLAEHLTLQFKQTSVYVEYDGYGKLFRNPAVTVQA